MQGEEAVLDLSFAVAGTLNAVAMWFELDLDEECSLRWGAGQLHQGQVDPGIKALASVYNQLVADCSTNPYSDKGLTWQQAVQWLPEVEVQPGQHLKLMARHDTYSISYSLPAEYMADCQEGGCAQDSPAHDSSTGTSTGYCTPAPAVTVSGQPRRTNVPFIDAAWKAGYEQLQGINGQLSKACVQNPLEYRAVAEAAVRFASRPHDFGLDAQQASEFCVKMMG
jgi:hypothetical protein